MLKVRKAVNGKVNRVNGLRVVKTAKQKEAEKEYSDQECYSALFSCSYENKTKTVYDMAVNHNEEDWSTKIQDYSLGKILRDPKIGLRRKKIYGKYLLLEAGIASKIADRLIGEVDGSRGLISLSPNSQSKSHKKLMEIAGRGFTRSYSSAHKIFDETEPELQKGGIFDMIANDLNSSDPKMRAFAENFIKGER